MIRKLILLTLLIACTVINNGFATANHPYVIVLKYATHPALDELENSFLETLKKNQQDVVIERFNANGDPALAKQLAESAVNRHGVDLIVSLATPATQAVVKSPSLSQIRILYAAVADPVGAGVVNDHTTGIQNAGPLIIKKTLDIIKEMYPNAKRIGTIYNPQEQNSLYVQRIIVNECKSRGLTIIQRVVTNPNQFQETVESLKSKIDVLYCTNDNLVNKGVLTIASTAKALKMPFIIGELSAVSKGSLAGVGVEYSSMGQHLAALAKDIINNPNRKYLPQREGPPAPQFWLNTHTAEEIHYIVSPSLKQKVNKFTN